jgi:hypothetical protein
MFVAADGVDGIGCKQVLPAHFEPPVKKPNI